MPSGTPPLPKSPPQPATSTASNECERFIDARLLAARRQIRGVDLAVGFLALAVVVLVYLLIAAILDHWLVVGGLGIWTRVVLWFGLVALAGSVFSFHLFLPLWRRINPLFAASTIEKSEPTLRNSLINFLLLRGHRSAVAPSILQAIERRAATDLSKVQLEVAVDRTRVVRLGTLLAVVVAVFALYLVISPKSPLRSAARVIWPWSSVASPTRVTISNVQPGDASAFHGDSISVSAEIAGLREGESPLLIYGTADGQIVEQTIPMTLPQGGYRHQGRLPPGNLGAQQDYIYFLSAGDCRTPSYRIKVETPPSLEVTKTSYRYPAYTGLAETTVERQGDLRAIEGTQVTLHATANTDIKTNTAEMDLGCTGRRGLPMSSEGRTATGRLTLRMQAEDPSQPEYDCYQLRFSDLQGRENRRPVRHRIDTIRDLSPDIAFLEPQTDETQVAEDGQLLIKVRAEDPDFALRRVTLRAEREGRGLLIPPLLERPKPEKPWSGPFESAYIFKPAHFGLKAGDRLPYWAEAEDVKEPAANRSVTEKRWIAVVGPELDHRQKQSSDRGQGEQRPPEAQQHAPSSDNRPERAKSPEVQPPNDDSPPPESSPDQPQQGEQEKGSAQPGQSGESGGDSDPAKRDEKNQQKGEGQQAENQQGPSSSDSRQDPGKQPAAEQPQNQPDGTHQKESGRQGEQASEQPKERIDPETAPGDAIQEILNDRQQQEQQSSQPSDAAQKNQEPKQQNAADHDPRNPSPDDKNAQGRPQKPSDQGAAKESSDERMKNEQAGSQAGEGGQASSEAKNQGKAGGEKAAGPEPSDQSHDTAQSSRDEPSGKKGAGGQSQAKDEPKGRQEKTGGNSQKLGDSSAEENRGEAKPTEKSEDSTPGGERSDGAANGDKQLEPSQEKSAEETRPGQTSSGQSQQPGNGQKAGAEGETPAPQESNRPKAKQPDETSSSPGENKETEPLSPSTSKRQSDSKGDTAGDRSGGGDQGGGQRDDRQGAGSPGSQTPADQGGSEAQESGDGDIASRPGDQKAAQVPVGSEKKQVGEGGGKSGQAASNTKPPATSEGESGTPSGQPAESGSAGRQATERPTPPTAGGQAGGQPGQRPASPTSEAAESEADAANLEFARRQTELALEHLRDQLAKEKPELLERLGWTKDDARRFLERWQGMRQAAEEKGATGETAKQRFNNAIKSLGLRPQGTELRHGGVTRDPPESLRDAGRFTAPPDWAEQLRAYTRGVAGDAPSAK